MGWPHSRCSLSVSWMAEWMKKKETQCGTYRFLFQKNEANHDNVYIASNGPIFKEAGNLLKQIEIREKQKKKKFFFNFQNCKGRSIRHIYEQVCIDLAKYIYVGSQFPSNLIFFHTVTWLHLLFNSRTGTPWLWAVSGRQRAGVLTVSVPCSWPWECTWWHWPCRASPPSSCLLPQGFPHWGPFVTCQLTFWAVPSSHIHQTWDRCPLWEA